MTVKEAFALYVQKSALEESSVEIKKRALRLFVKSAGDLQIGKVGYAEAEDYRVWLVKNQTKESANIYLANFKPFFGWLAKRGYIERNPFATVKLFEADARRKEVFEPAEIERILRVADLRWQAITLLGLCSLRRSETLNLTINDLCFEKGYCRVEPKQESPTMWPWSIKNHRRAIVPMPEVFTLPDMVVNLHRVLRDLIADLPYGQPYLCVQPIVYGRMLAMKMAGGLSWRWRNCPWQNFTRDWLRLLRQASVRRKRYQDLRATLPTIMARRGVPITDTQRLLRHKSIQTTAQYYIKAEEQKLMVMTAGIAAKFYETTTLP